eukprot:10935386-Lingulodinium_polyedra.AAC.1
MTREGVVRAAGFRRLADEERWQAPDWPQLKGLLWDAKEGPREAIAPQPPRRRYVARGDLRKYGVAAGCA